LALGEPRSQSDLRRELPDLANKLRADQSFANAQEVERAKGWRIVKGFAVYDLYDCPEGEAYVGYRHWWNVNDDDTWCAARAPSLPPLGCAEVDRYSGVERRAASGRGARCRRGRRRGRCHFTVLEGEGACVLTAPHAVRGAKAPGAKCRPTPHN